MYVNELGSCDCGKTRKCKICQLGYNRAWYVENRESQHARVVKNKARAVKEANEFIRKEKSKPCTDCGKGYHWFAMDFDHLSDKERSISRCARNGWTLERIKKEIAKCDLVCATCHRLRTVKRVEAGETTWNEVSLGSAEDSALVS